MDAGSTSGRHLIDAPHGFDGKMFHTLFCVSSINGGSDRAYGMQGRFVSNVLPLIPDRLRTDLVRLLGEGVSQ